MNRRNISIKKDPRLEYQKIADKTTIPNRVSYL